MKEDYILIGKNILEIIIVLIILCISGKLIIFYLPFFIAYIISSILEPIIKFINRRGINRKPASIILLISIVGVILAIFIWGLSSLFNEANNLLNGLNNYLNKTINLFKDITSKINIDKFKIFESTFYDILKMITEYIKEFLTSVINNIKNFPSILINLIITILACYLFLSDKFYILDSLEFHFSKKMISKIFTLFKKITSSLGEYIKAEIILSIVTFIIILISLNLFYLFGMKIEYPILIALAIGFVDLLPIFGAGFILLPWSFILFISKEFTFGFWVLALYFITLIVKQLLEPKLISKGLGIHPIFTLISMYTGFKLIGVFGLVIGPIILIVLKHIFSDYLDKGLVNSLSD